MRPGKKKWKYNCDMFIEHLKFNRPEKHYKNGLFFIIFLIEK